MEQNVQVIAKKTWHIVKVAYFLLRKNISKRKFLLELKYLTTKRPKLTGKSFSSKSTHRHQGGAYEFSCGNTPSHPNYFSFNLNHNKRAHKNKVNSDEERELHAVNRVLEMMLTVSNNAENDDVEGSPSPFPYPSPILPGFGFGRSPVARQLRVTDSPYAMQNCDEGDQMSNYHVDDAAEEFIKRFYDQLQQQRINY